MEEFGISFAEFFEREKGNAVNERSLFKKQVNTLSVSRTPAVFFSLPIQIPRQGSVWLSSGTSSSIAGLSPDEDVEF